MPIYTLQDEKTGRILEVEGKEPPSSEVIADLFERYGTEVKPVRKQIYSPEQAARIAQSGLEAGMPDAAIQQFLGKAKADYEAYPQPAPPELKAAPSEPVPTGMQSFAQFAGLRPFGGAPELPQQAAADRMRAMQETMALERMMPQLAQQATGGDLGTTRPSQQMLTAEEAQQVQMEMAKRAQEKYGVPEWVTDAAMKGGAAADIGISVGVPLAVSAFTANPAVGGAVGSAIANPVVQFRQMLRGERSGFSPTDFFTDVALGAYTPKGLKETEEAINLFRSGMGKLPSGARMVEDIGPLQKLSEGVVTRAGQGTIMGIGGEAARQTLEEPSVDVKQILNVGALSTLFGATFGGLEKTMPSVWAKIVGKQPAEAAQILRNEPQTPAVKEAIVDLEKMVERRLAPQPIDRAAAIEATIGIPPAKPTPVMEGEKFGDLPPARQTEILREEAKAFQAMEPFEKLPPVRKAEEAARILEEAAMQKDRAIANAAGRLEEHIDQGRLGSEEISPTPEMDRVRKLNQRLMELEQRRGESAREKARIEAKKAEAIEGFAPEPELGAPTPEPTPKLSPQAQDIMDRFGGAGRQLVAGLGVGGAGFVVGWNTGEGMPVEDRLDRALAFGAGGLFSPFAIRRIISLQGWANSVLRERGPGSGALNTADPEIIAALGVKGAAFAGETLPKNFTEWGRVMMNRFGSEIRPKLKEIWNAGRQAGLIPSGIITDAPVLKVTEEKLPSNTAGVLLYSDYPKSPVKRTNSEVAELVQTSAIEANGMRINSGNITPEQEARITNNAVDEVVAGLKVRNHAGEWYTTQVDDGNTVLGVMFPALQNDELARSTGRFNTAREARVAAAVAQAATSQNLTVAENGKYTVDQFESLLKNGNFNPTIAEKYGKVGKSIAGNLDLANKMVESVGWNGLDDFIRKDFTIRQLQEAVKKATGKDVSIAGKMDDVVQGAAIFGPKIGQGFLQNLLGRFDPVTIDLWMRRTWGRWTGDVLPEGILPEQLGRYVKTLRDAGMELPESLRGMRITLKGKTKLMIPESFNEKLATDDAWKGEIYQHALKVFERWDKDIYPYLKSNMTPKQREDVLSGKLSVANLAEQLRKSDLQIEATWNNLPKGPVREQPSAEFVRGRAKGSKKAFVEQTEESFGRTSKLSNEEISDLKPEWAKSSTVIVNAFEPIDIPSGKDREVITRVVNNVRRILNDRGIRMTNADIQATLWYPEKDIWAKLAGEPESGLKQSYDTVFLELAEKRGIGNQAREALATARAARDRRAADAGTTKAIGTGTESPETLQAADDVTNRIRAGIPAVMALAGYGIGSATGDTESDQTLNALIGAKIGMAATGKSGQKIGQVTGIDTRSLLRTLGNSMYDKSLPSTLAKELSQNAIDASRGVKNPTIYFGTTGDRKVAEATNTIPLFFGDNGVGMSPKTLVTKFLPAGASGKNSDMNVVGGFGLAKLAILGSPQSFEVKTVTVMPDGEKLRTTLNGTGEGWMDFAASKSLPKLGELKAGDAASLGGDLTVFVERVDPSVPTGTSMQMYLPEQVNGKNVLVYDFERTIKHLIRNSSVDLSAQEVFRTDYPSQNSVFEKYEPLSEIFTTKKREVHDSVSVDGAKIELMFDPQSEIEKIWNIPVLNSGMVQFSNMLGEDIRLPSSLVINVSPKVGVTNPDYPFTPNRDALKGPAKTAVEKMIRDLGDIQKRNEVKMLTDNLEKAPNIPNTRHQAVDLSMSVPKSVLDQVIHDPAIQAMSSAFDLFYRKMRSAAGDKGYNDIYADANYRGLIFNGEAYGLRVGKQVAGSEGRMFHDPLLMSNHADAEIKAGRYNWTATPFLDAFTDLVSGVSLHEMSHQVSFREGETHARAMTFNAGMFARPLVQAQTALYDRLLEEGAKLLRQVQGLPENANVPVETVDKFLRQRFLDHHASINQYANADKTDSFIGAITSASQESSRLGPTVSRGSATRAEAGGVEPRSEKVQPGLSAVLARRPNETGRDPKVAGFVAKELALPLAGFAGGFTYGMIEGRDKSPEQRLTNALLMGAAGGALSPLVLGKAIKSINSMPPKPPPATQAVIGQNVPTRTLDDVRNIFREKPDAPSFAEKIRKLPADAITTLQNKYYALAELQKSVLGYLPKLNLADRFSLIAGAAGKAEADLIDLSKIRESLIPDISADDLNSYMFLRRTFDRLTTEQNNPQLGSRVVSDYGIPEVQAHLNTLRGELGTDKMMRLEKFAEELQKSADADLQLMVSTGRMSQDQYNEIKALNDFYAPFYVMEYISQREGSTLPGIGGAIDTTQSLTQGVKGISDKDFKLGDMMTAFGANKLRAYVLAEKNLAMRDLANLAVSDPKGNFIKDLGFAAAKLNAPKGWEIVSYMKDGKVKHLAVSPEVAKAVKNMDYQQLNLINRIMAATANPLRAGATGLNLAFQVVNQFKDLGRLGLVSKYGLRSISDLVMFPLDVASAAASSWKSNVLGSPDELMMEYLRSGASRSTIASQLSPDTFTRFAQQKDQSAAAKLLGVPVRTFIDSTTKIGNAIEETAKLAGFKRGLRIENLDKLSPAAREEAIQRIAYEVRNYAGSPDFSKHGTIGRELNVLFMFLNARIQGTAADLRRLSGGTGTKEGWEAALKLAMGIGGLTTYVWYKNHQPDNIEDYNSRPLTERNNYFLIPRYNKAGQPMYYINEDGEKVREYWRYPKAEVIGQVANITEGALDFFAKKDPKAALNAGTAVLESLSPVSISGRNLDERFESILSGLNPILKAPIEYSTNRNLFGHRDIVPRRLQQASPQEQYKETTPPAFITAAQAMPEFMPEKMRSPLHMQQLVSNFTGGMLTQFMRPELEGRDPLSSNPVLGRFFSAPYLDKEEDWNEIKKYQTMQADKSLTRDRAIDSFIKNSDRMPIPDRMEALRQIIIANPEKNARALLDNLKDKNAGTTEIDRAVRNLTPNLRAQYLEGRRSKLPDQQSQAQFYMQMYQRGILTPETVAEIAKLRKLEAETAGKKP